MTTTYPIAVLLPARSLAALARAYPGTMAALARDYPADRPAPVAPPTDWDALRRWHALMTERSTGPKGRAA